MREQYEKGDDQSDGGFWSPPPAYLILAVVAVVAAAILLGPVSDEIEQGWEDCRQSGGEIGMPGEGEVLYCLFENGTGYKLGVEDQPRPIETQSSA
jgi:hypothetical protein